MQRATNREKRQATLKATERAAKNGLKTADILTEKPKVQVPMMIGGQCLKHELERKPWKPSGLFSPDFQPAFTPITSEQRTAIDRIMKNLIPSKPDSGLNTED